MSKVSNRTIKDQVLDFYKLVKEDKVSNSNYIKINGVIDTARFIVACQQFTGQLFKTETLGVYLRWCKRTNK